MEDWTEKYRPKSLDDIVGNDNAVRQLRSWANSWNKQIPKKRAVVLSGKAGVGKTSSAHALANDFNWTVIELNTSDARNATKIKNIATSGAINETFNNQGQYIQSKNGGKKLIILDEADNLYDKSSKDPSSGQDLSDRGGKKAIVDTIKQTKQPIVLIVNNYYDLIKGSGDSLKYTCKLIKFFDPYPSAIFNLLRKICMKEGINANNKVLNIIAERCKGDIRSAVNDLHSITLDKNQIDSSSLDVLGYRDREKIVFDAMREVFKTKNLQSIKENMLNIDLDPNTFLLWVNENLPKEYKDHNDLVKAYSSLSKADVFLGRTRKKQNYSLWPYACDLMNGGVANAKTRIYPNERYDFPVWLKSYKNAKASREIRDSLIKKISNSTHNSDNKSKESILKYFKLMFNINTNFASNMKNKLDLSEKEILYLLDEKKSYKLKEILNNKEEIQKPDVKELPDKKEKENKTNVQKSLF